MLFLNHRVHCFRVPCTLCTCKVVEYTVLEYMHALYMPMQCYNIHCVEVCTLSMSFNMWQYLLMLLQKTLSESTLYVYFPLACFRFSTYPWFEFSISARLGFPIQAKFWVLIPFMSMSTSCMGCKQLRSCLHVAMIDDEQLSTKLWLLVCQQILIRTPMHPLKWPVSICMWWLENWSSFHLLEAG